MSQSLREKGRRELAEAKAAYKAETHPAASGIILHRKDNMVLDGKFKWIPCVWTFRESSLVLAPCAPPGGGADKSKEKEESFEIRDDTQYTKPNRKHYPIQFGSEDVHTAVILEKIVYAPTGYAPSPVDPLRKPASEDMRAVCKLGALELADLEKLLTCIQAVIEGKKPDEYL